MCFPYGLDAAIRHGDGHIVALRITERPGGSPMSTTDTENVTKLDDGLRKREP